MSAATTTRPAYLGRCTAKGCRYTSRVLADTGTVTRRNRYGAWDAEVDGYVRDHRFYAFHDDRGYWTAGARHYFDDCPACPDHGRLKWARIAGTYNAEVRCDARCEGARRPDCECSCGGANHGGRWGA